MHTFTHMNAYHAHEHIQSRTRTHTFTLNRKHTFMHKKTYIHAHTHMRAHTHTPESVVSILPSFPSELAPFSDATTLLEDAARLGGRVPAVVVYLHLYMFACICVCLRAFVYVCECLCGGCCMAWSSSSIHTYVHTYTAV